MRLSHCSWMGGLPVAPSWLASNDKGPIHRRKRPFFFPQTSPQQQPSFLNTSKDAAIIKSRPSAQFLLRNSSIVSRDAQPIMIQ